MQRFEGRSILVAGSGAIGGACARRYALEGASVVIGDINPESAHSVAHDISQAGGRAIGALLDGADEQSIRDVIALCTERFGGLDGAHINFASFADTMDDNIVEVPLETFDKSIEVNVRGFTLCTRAIVPVLAARGGGPILYTSSSAAYLGSPGLPAYAMSKSAIQALMRHVASRYGADSIRANCIAPGLMLHPRLEKTLSDSFKQKAMRSTQIKSRLGRPDDVAAMAALLLSDEGAYITGQVINIDGGAIMRS